MTIAGVSHEWLREVFAENLTLSDTVKTPERLFGREKNLCIDRPLISPSRQIVIYGDRGVGKTCLARCRFPNIRPRKAR
jgi:Cdc6-like AAA superfamily ATPase